MTLVVAARNAALDAVTIDSMSLHSGFPGETGANELTGSGYARQTTAFAAASGGVRTLSTAETFTVGAGHTVRWIGLWSGSTFRGYSPNGGSPQEFTVAIATDVVTALAHGFSDTNTIVFYGGTVPSPLVEGTVYYVRDATTDTFKVAATAGGAAIDLTGAGASDCVVSRIFEDAYAGADTHQISAFTIGAVS
jgi:hypothetical protein